MYITHVVFTFDYGTETKDIMKHRVPAKNFAAGCKELLWICLWRAVGVIVPFILWWASARVEENKHWLAFDLPHGT